MRVEASDSTLEVWPGVPATLSVNVFNTDDVINGYSIHVLGVDPEWVELDVEQLNLFPDDMATATIVLRLPDEFPAGSRTLAVVVENVMDPSSFRVAEIDLTIEPILEARMYLEPAVITGGRTGTFSMVITNTGNAWAQMRPLAEEKEAKAQIEMTPELVDVPPGEQTTVTARVRRRRPFIGNFETRVITFRVEGVDDPPLAIGSFNQRALIGRGLVSLFGLLATIAVFGLVIYNSIGNVVEEGRLNDQLLQSAIDDEDAAAVAAAEQAAAESRTIRGSVTDNGSQSDLVSNITVQLFDAEDGESPVATAKTSKDGEFTFVDVAPGEYTVRVVGAGFLETWHESAGAFGDAETFTVAKRSPDDPTTNDPVPVTVTILAKPGQVSGSVLAADPSDVTISLIRIRNDVRVGTVAQTVTDGSGSFLLEDVDITRSSDLSIEPYELVAEKDGFAEERRLISLSDGEVIDDIRIRLREGDARVSGAITLDGEVPAADQLIEIQATTGTDTYSTVTFGTGEYVLRDLPSPALYSITATRTGFFTETRTVQVDSGASVGGVDLDLTRSVRAVSGVVTDESSGATIASVAITVGDGRTTFRTRTGSDGSYEVRGLSDANSYTVTARREGYRDRTESFTCSARTGCTRPLRLTRSSSAIFGVVCLRESPTSDGSGDPPTNDEDVRPIGGVRVQVDGGDFSADTLSADRVSNTVTVAPDPYAGSDCAGHPSTASNAGYFQIGEIPDGTYTVTFTQEDRIPFTQVITVPRAEPVHQTILNTSSVTVTVYEDDDGSGPGERTEAAGATVSLWRKSDFDRSDGSGPPTYDPQTTPTNGTVVFGEVEAPEEYIVVVEYRREGENDTQEQSQSFPLKVGESKILEFTFTPSGSP